MSVGSSNTIGSAPRPILWAFSHSIYHSFSWIYDYVFCGAIVYWLGPIWGGALLTVTSAGVDYATLKVYQSSKADLLGIEYLRSFRSYTGRNIIKNFFRFILTSTPTWAQIILLTPQSNAFLTTALLRERADDFTYMSSRDWIVFWTSFLCSQLYWVAIVYFGIESVQGIFAMFENLN